MLNHPQEALGSPAITRPDLALLPNSPNPFIEMTLLWFSLPEPADVILRVFDQQGREVAVKSGYFARGENHLVLKRSDIRDPGIYQYRLETPFGEASRRLVMY